MKTVIVSRHQPLRPARGRSSVKWFRSLCQGLGRSRCRVTCTAALIPLLFVACSGRVGTAVGANAPDLTGAGGNGGADGAQEGVVVDFGDGEAKVFIPAPGPLQLLTPRQYAHAVRDLLGLPEATVGKLALDPVSAISGYESIGAGVTTPSLVGVEVMGSEASRLATAALTSSNARAAIVGCNPPGGAVDRPCARRFVERFGRRAFRRPLKTEETERWLSIFESVANGSGDFWQGAKWVITGLLQSPHFLYRTAIGEAVDGKPGLRRLSGYELATRLSFALRDTCPDDALLDAAEAGRLDDQPGLAAEAERLLKDGGGNDGARAFFSEWLGLDALDKLPQSPTAFPQLVPGLPAKLRAQTLATLIAVGVEGDDVRDVMNSRTLFTDADLSRIYALPSPMGAAMTRVELPPESPRRGLLGLPSILALGAHATSTSPSLRGKMIRERLLCQTIPPPPPNASTELPDPSAAEGSRTARERLAPHTNVPGCASCHALMDPIGLALETFDGLGVHRQQENGANIDPRGTLDGVAFRDAASLADLLRNDDRLGPCVVTNFMRFVLGQSESGETDPGLLHAQSAFAREQHRWGGLVRAVVNSPAFYLVAADNESNQGARP